MLFGIVFWNYRNAARPHETVQAPLRSEQARGKGPAFYQHEKIYAVYRNCDPEVAGRALEENLLTTVV